jgi:hypothetical protein
LDDFESKMDGVNDTVEFVIRVAIVTLSAVILVVVAALAVALFVPNELVDSTAILETINPAFQTIVGAFVGLLGGLSLNANARDKEEPNEPTDPIVGGDLPSPDAPKPEADVVAPAAVVAEPAVEAEDLDDDDDDDMAEYEKYRHDLRYDTNGDGIVSDDEMPNWRNPAA